MPSNHKDFFENRLQPTSYRGSSSESQPNIANFAGGCNHGIYHPFVALRVVESEIATNR